MTAIGIDLGGTNLRAARFEALDKDNLKADTELRRPVGEPRDPETICSLVASAVKELAKDPVPLGIGFAGMLRGHDGMVANSPYMRWRDVPFGTMLRDALPGYPIWLGNDVNAICYGESQLGAAAGAKDVLTVFIGTGIGGGMVVGGTLVEAATNCAGEIGHTKVDFSENARPCACGMKGCVEAYAGGQNIQDRVRTELAHRPSLAVELAGGADRVHAGHIDEAAAQGDDYALALWAEIAPLAGAAIANATTLLNPSHVVLGGGVLSRTPVLREYIEAAFHVLVNPPAGASVKLVDAALGDDAGVIGSALRAQTLLRVQAPQTE